ncbi:MAG: 50S ribosomal protein L29 [Bryobacteraceae bacterium]|nr:50S ribosomal protein L29 [Bryobacteraceae bacterium]
MPRRIDQLRELKTEELTAQERELYEQIFRLRFQLVSGQQDPGLIAQIAANLLLLSFSRDHERDADAHSVIYLCPTEYRADGAADFFEYLIQGGGVRPPAFLSTHPDPGERVQNIRTLAQQMACTGTQIYEGRYAQLVAALP